ncbi:hypothetical protein EWB00_000451 [Schistosoma japonicum]|uniref:Uncharacterized protein n=1 Tax=Schistosoma japonicum TaxID=6182 RepID=A0A4Z2CK88_SCHJA|nr:hypothetical protein EWB00_000451 [Schistosoma japonicum]
MVLAAMGLRSMELPDSSRGTFAGGLWASAGHGDSHLCLLPRGHSEEEGEQHSPLRQAQDEPAPGASSCSQLPGG